MPATDINEVLAGLKSAQQKPLDMLTKSTFTESMSATSGLTFYDLELGAKFVYPVLTPLRNAIPRVSGKGGLAANWRSVTAINTQNMRFGVSAANRGGVLAVATQDYSAAYKGIGVETSVDFEAQYAGQGFDDVRAVAAKTGLESLMLGEEAMILGGCASTPLGTTPTPTLSDVGTGGSLAANLAQSVICAALTHDGVMNATLAAGIQGQITRTNADGTTDTFGGGAAARSANATITTASDGNATHLIRASVAPVAGALGYAWFWGAAGAETLGAITSIASVTIASAATGTQTAASLGTADSSVNALAFDGLITQAIAAGASFDEGLASAAVTQSDDFGLASDPYTRPLDMGRVGSGDGVGGAVGWHGRDLAGRGTAEHRCGGERCERGYHEPDAARRARHRHRSRYGDKPLLDEERQRAVRQRPAPA